MRGDEVLIDAHVKVAFVSGGRARPIPKPLRIAMRADQRREPTGLTSAPSRLPAAVDAARRLM